MSTSELDPAHYSVMLEESISALHIQPDGFYVDATFGRGGHSSKILNHLSAAGHLLMLDRDPVAIEAAQERFGSDPRVTIVQSPFSQLQQVLDQLGVETVDGMLFDLGVSSPQLDQASRGFSFQQDGPLDMRMNPQQEESAATWIASASQEEIARVLWEYGDERHSRRIARSILRAREEQPIETTLQLAELIKRTVPGYSKRHPATRSFQAIRIHINRELQELRELLDQAVDRLATGGRIVIISFHSLEDRMVKRFFKKCGKGGAQELPHDLPIRVVEESGVMKSIGKAQFPSAKEIEENPRSRSAVLRVAERLPLKDGVV